MSSEHLYEVAKAFGTFGEVAGQALIEMFEKIGKASEPLIKTFNDLYIELSEAMGNKQKRKELKERSVRDRRQQLKRSIKRQQMLKENWNKSNNWKRLHGLPAKRKVKKQIKRN